MFLISRQRIVKPAVFIFRYSCLIYALLMICSYVIYLTAPFLLVMRFCPCQKPSRCIGHVNVQVSFLITIQLPELAISTLDIENMKPQNYIDPKTLKSVSNQLYPAVFLGGLSIRNSQNGSHFTLSQKSESHHRSRSHFATPMMELYRK